MTKYRDLTLILPYYENAQMFREQQRVWLAYPNDLKEHLHVIVVDDGSPTAPARWEVLAGLGLASVRLYRIGVDVRWNWLACRNLGAAEAYTDWMLMTDMDHVVPSDTLRAILTSKLRPNRAYRFQRVSAPDLAPYKPHPNSWLFTRHVFLDEIGGYDERFSGYYGTDGEFRSRVEAATGEVLEFSAPLIRYPREVIPDASTTQYGRKEPQDIENVRRIREERDRIPNWYPKRLSFPWERQL